MRLTGLFASAALLALTIPASAQDANVEGRVGKLEKEMKAVQRKVFPDGAGKYFEPEIKSPDAVKDPNKSTSGSEVTDLISRVDALEGQLATLTGQVEQNNNAMRSMETRLKALESKVKALDAAATAEPVAASSRPVASDPPVIAASTKAPATAVKPPPTPTTKPAAAKPPAGRAAAVAKIEKPQTGDGFEDGYNYGYRLWEAKYFPEAQVQLEETVKKYPNHKRISFARNLLGRAWLDDGRPSQAAKIFYDNYKSDANGERAPESLYFLGESLIKMNKLTDACDVFGQLSKAYPDVVAGRLANRVAEGRKKAKCK
jgi:TolA-binding protein